MMMIYWSKLSTSPVLFICWDQLCLLEFRFYSYFFEQNLYGYYNGAYTQEQPAHIDLFYILFRGRRAANLVSVLECR